jgi:ABC-type transport system involved in multi-copper enzyme maturation permease subunit
MTASVASPAGARAGAPAPAPSFAGAVGGELFKLTRNRIAWVASALFVCFLVAPFLFASARPQFRTTVHSDPTSLITEMMEISLLVLRVMGGIYLLILGALAVGLEYSYGTIRVLLGRGLGRLHLLGAKALALATVGVGVLVFALALDSLLMGATVLALGGNLSAFGSLTATFWTYARVYLLTTAVSMGVTLLLAIAVAVVGRSLAFGLSVALVWFPADNIGTIVMLLLNHFTGSAFWTDVTGFFLGPVLNAMPAYYLPMTSVTVQTEQGVRTFTQTAPTIGLTPLSTIDGTHAALVVLGYAVVFAAVAIVLTWRRDVLE